MKRQFQEKNLLISKAQEVTQLLYILFHSGCNHFQSWMANLQVQQIPQCPILYCTRVQLLQNQNIVGATSKRVLRRKKNKNKEAGSLPSNLPRSLSTRALRYIVSISTVTAWNGSAGELEYGRGFCWPTFLAIDIFISGISVDTFIPSNTRSASSICPLWYSTLPSNALAS